MTSLPISAEVVIVGGGIIGASVAWHLARRGCHDVLVLERSSGPGAGSTGRATGGFRAQFGSEINVRLSLLARDQLRRFPEEFGVDPGYHPRGYLLLVDREADLEELRRAQQIQHACGLIEAHEVSPDDIHRLNPAIAPDGLLGGAFCPTDGFVRPLQVLEGFSIAARRAGVRFQYGVEVTGFELSGSEISGVRTRGGTVSTRMVVNAAGAWAGPVAGLAGVHLPVSPVRRQVACTVPTEVLAHDLPMTVYLGDGFHFRVRDGRVLLLMPGPVATDPFDMSFERSWLPALQQRTRVRVPVLADVEIDPPSCWAGLYEMSPDGHAILGPAPERKNLFLVNGSSGHGVMHAGPLGMLLAELMLEGRATTLDVNALRPTRFAEGQPNAASLVI